MASSAAVTTVRLSVCRGAVALLNARGSPLRISYQSRVGAGGGVGGYRDSCAPVCGRGPAFAATGGTPSDSLQQTPWTTFYLADAVQPSNRISHKPRRAARGERHCASSLPTGFAWFANAIDSTADYPSAANLLGIFSVHDGSLLSAASQVPGLPNSWDPISIATMHNLFTTRSQPEHRLARRRGGA